MNPKHLKVRVAQCDLIATSSPCSRRKVGALIINPAANVVISEGYNGTPRQSAHDLCGGSSCLRDSKAVASGTQNDIGCHHAEMNAIFNAARIGQSTVDAWLISNCDPCLMCAKAIHHSGIVKVFVPYNLRGDHIEGLDYLAHNNVRIESTDRIKANDNR